MMFQNPRDTGVALLILRHLYDGDVIDWPMPDDVAQAPIFKGLEAEGYIARWDRIWPLTDRYRLTEKGIKTIESVYRPSGAEQLFAQLVARNLSPSARPPALRAMGCDPTFWPVLHDPHTHWMSWPEQPGPYQRYVWEPEPKPAAPVGKKPQPKAPKPAPAKQARGPQRQGARVQGSRGGGGPRVVHHHHHHHEHDIHHRGGVDDGSFDPLHRGIGPGGEYSDEPYTGGGGESGGGGASGSYDDGPMENVDLDSGGGYDPVIGSDLS
jgi:hypothetical protein